jgi:hypothetical protein
MDVPTYHTESLGKEGLLLFYESNEINEIQKRNWFFSLLDTSLTEKWVQIVPLTDGMSFHTSERNANGVVLLFTANSKSKSQSVNYEVITYNNKLEQFNLIGGIIPDKATITGFAALDRSALMAINLPKSKSDFLFFDLQNGSVVSIQNSIGGDVLVNDLASIKSGSIFVAAISQEVDKGPMNNYFVVFDHRGTIIRTFLHEDLQHRSLHSFAFEREQTSGDIIVIGSFSYDVNKKDKPKQKEEDEDEAAGLFYLRFSEHQAEQANFIDFKDFKNIYKALAAEDLMQIRQKQSRSNNEKADTPAIAFRLFNPNLITIEDKLVYSAEAYRPQYRLESRTEYDFYGRPIPYTYSVFEGYNFFTTILGVFNQQGELSWSYNFEIPEIISFQLQAHTLIQPDSSDLVFCVLKDGLLNSSVIGMDGNEIGSMEQTKVASDFANDRLLEEDFTSVIHWYENNYIGMGYQKIANNKLVDNNPRTVFYLNKLSFH